MARHRDSTAAPERGPILPPRAFLRPAVLMELVIGLSPLAGVAFWGWDVVPALMLHLLALAVSAGFLVLRTAALSDGALAYLTAGDKSKPARRPGRGMRWWLSGFLIFILGGPLSLLSAFIVVEFGGAHAPVRGTGDFWRVIVVSSGLWIPLVAVCLWETGSFIADAVLPRLRLRTKLRAPARPVAAGYAMLSPELQAYLYVRAWVVVRMVVTAFGIGVGLFFSAVFGVVAVIVMLVALKTSVAVAIEAFAGVDAERRQATGGLRRSPPAAGRA